MGTPNFMSARSTDKESHPEILSLHPRAAIAGGDFEIRGSALSPDDGRQPVVRFGDVAGRLVIGGSDRVVVRVPAEAVESQLTLEYNGSKAGPQPCSVGVVIAENLHPVANPAVDAEGNVYTTRSGSRGESVPVSVFKIDTNNNVRPFVSEIVNPTGLLIDAGGNLLISARNDGTVYTVAPDGQLSVYAEGMGVATGLAADLEGDVYVGDRTGTIFKIAQDRQIFVFATLEPSIAAYHLAFGPDGLLYVTGPTTSSFDCIHRVDPSGDVEEWLRGFGRPQGLAFDPEGRLYVAASYRGHKGVFRVDPNQNVEQVVSGPGIVGMAFLPSGDMVVTTNSNVYRISTAGWASA